MSLIAGLTQAERELLAEIGRDNVSWRQQVGRKPSFRLWSSGSDYELVTRVASRLVDAGLAKTQMANGYRHISKGYVELTPEGHKRLRDVELAIKTAAHSQHGDASDA